MSLSLAYPEFQTIHSQWIHILQTKIAKTLLAVHVLLYSIILKKKKTITQESKACTLQTAKIDGDLLITEKNFAHATTVFSELYRARGQN